MADIGERIRAAREALDYTQEELARAVGLNREAVVNIEGGRRKVKADELWRIARELETPIVHFLQDLPRMSLAVVEARRGEAATREARRAELWLRRHFDDYQQLLRVLGRDGTPNVSLDWPEAGAIVDGARRAADAQRRQHGLGNRPIPDLREHLEDNVRVPVFGRAVRDTDFCGILLLEQRASAAAMLVNAELLTSRRNFTMAHEYGHLLWKLRRKEATADVFYRHPAETEEEMFANAFAAQFLAPDDALRENAAQLNVSAGRPDSVAELAASYGVSFQMMTYRLQNLRLLLAPDAEDLRRTIRPADLPSFRRERQAFYAISPLYWDLVLEAYSSDELDAARCGEMVDQSALEFEELIDDLGTELVSETALSAAAD